MFYTLLVHQEFVHSSILAHAKTAEKNIVAASDSASPLRGRIALFRAVDIIERTPENHLSGNILH